MLAYAANITQLYQGIPLDERYARMGAAGFTSYELLFPQREDLEEVLALQEQYSLDLALFDLEFDADHPRGNLSDPDERAFFYRLEEAVGLALKLKCRRLNALVGLVRPDLSTGEQIELIADRLRRASDMVSGDGLLLLVEALNSRDNPGYFLSTSARAIALVQAVERPNVLFQYDVYHMQIMEGNLIDTIRQNIDSIGHVQIADVPGRHEPGTGEINYANVLAALEATGYNGFVGLELTPSDLSADPFAWLSAADRARRLDGVPR